MTAQLSDTVPGRRGPGRSALAEREPAALPWLAALLGDGAGAWGGTRRPAAHEGFAALRFDATPGSVTRARGFLRSTLTGWRMDELVDDATAVAAELVANAVTHALAPPADSAWIALVRSDDAVVCAVADPSPLLPAVGDPGPLAESGRGLRIVAELSDSWGHSQPRAAGKTVWARLSPACAPRSAVPGRG
jgi:anti-sigma regulatory factor (Ser/Thr protein kinase)